MCTSFKSSNGICLAKILMIHPQMVAFSMLGANFPEKKKAISGGVTQH